MITAIEKGGQIITRSGVTCDSVKLTISSVDQATGLEKSFDVSNVPESTTKNVFILEWGKDNSAIHVVTPIAMKGLVSQKLQERGYSESPNGGVAVSADGTLVAFSMAKATREQFNFSL